MKLSLVFLASVLVLGLAAAVPTGSVVKSPTACDLNEALNDFLTLVPQDEVFTVVILYLATDKEVQAIVTYAESYEFKRLILALEAIPELIDILNYVNDAGLDVYTWANKLHDLLGLDELEVPTRSISGRSVSRITGGIKGLIQDIKDVLPIDDIKSLYAEKLTSCEAFAALVQKFVSEDFKTLIAALKANEEFQGLVAKASGDTGIDFKAVVHDLISLIGRS